MNTRTLQRHYALLAILYISFISLGLPDTVLGVAWPEMRISFAKPLAAAGILLSLTTVLSVFSSMASGAVMARWSTGVILTACGCMTCAAMLGYALSPFWGLLVACTVLFGIGQGAVDTAVNAHMARNYSARHMNWVHACWGLGATAGPFIMTSMFAAQYSWRTGYACIAAIQCAFSILFLATLRLWKEPQAATETRQEHPPQLPQAEQAEQATEELLPSQSLRGNAASGMLFYFLYPSIEVVAGLWGASYLIDIMRSSPSAAGTSITLYWGALAAGRISAGCIAGRFSNVALIRGGCALALCGALVVQSAETLLAFRLGMMCIGLGLAPLYPSMMHDTPRRVGLRFSDKLVGFQVGSAMAGATVLPPLLGWVAGNSSLAVFGPALIIGIILVLGMHELSLLLSISRKTRARGSSAV